VALGNAAARPSLFVTTLCSACCCYRIPALTSEIHCSCNHRAHITFSPTPPPHPRSPPTTGDPAAVADTTAPRPSTPAHPYRTRFVSQCNITFVRPSYCGELPHTAFNMSMDQVSYPCTARIPCTAHMRCECMCLCAIRDRKWPADTRTCADATTSDWQRHAARLRLRRKAPHPDGG
jgi:hypothetical protein